MPRRKKAGKLAEAAVNAYKEAKRTSKPGQGKRFKALTRVLEARGAENPEALAAWIGRRKYGAKQMAEWSRKGRKRR